MQHLNRISKMLEICGETAKYPIVQGVAWYTHNMHAYVSLAGHDAQHRPVRVLELFGDWIRNNEPAGDIDALVVGLESAGFAVDRFTDDEGFKLLWRFEKDITEEQYQQAMTL